MFLCEVVTVSVATSSFLRNVRFNAPTATPKLFFAKTRVRQLGGFLFTKK